MKAHDPNDDPFAALCADYDESHALPTPTEFGSGAISKNAPESPEETSAKKNQEDVTEATVDEHEEERDHDEADAPKNKEEKEQH